MKAIVLSEIANESLDVIIDSCKERGQLPQDAEPTLVFGFNTEGYLTLTALHNNHRLFKATIPNEDWHYSVEEKQDASKQ